MKSIDNLLSRLTNLKETGAGRWLARCPAHDDKSPSLSVRELDDGRILVHCFAGCSASDVVVSLGLGLGDLFPDRPEHRQGLPDWKRKRFESALDHERYVIAIYQADQSEGRPITPEDTQRAALAAERIRKIQGVLSHD